MSTSTYDYEFYTIHTDSISSNSWINGVQSDYVNYLTFPLKNVVQVSVVSASFSATGSNVAYLYSKELTSTYNQVGGVAGSTGVGFEPSTKGLLNGSVAKFNVAPSGRTEYKQNDFSSQTSFMTPVTRLDRIETRLLDQVGDPLTTVSNIFVTYKFTCIR